MMSYNTRHDATESKTVMDAQITSYLNTDAVNSNVRNASNLTSHEQE